MSYVDLMSCERWTEADHVRRTEAMVRQHWSAEDETILNRKVLGAAIGQYSLNAQDQADLADFKAVTEAAQIAGIDGRVDAMLLNAVLDIEAAGSVLAAIPPAPESPDEPDPYAAPREEAAAAYQALVATASSDVTQLLADRQALRPNQNPVTDTPTNDL